MNSQRVRLMGLAAGAVAVGVASCAEAVSSVDRERHLATTPADFAALGIGPNIAVREDGRRTTQSAETFEWRYFAGLLDDGSRAGLKISDHLLTSADLITDQSFTVRAVASVMAMKPWHTRFESPITLSLPGDSPAPGQGTLEDFELK
jgi:hypothetical protein